MFFYFNLNTEKKVTHHSEGCIVTEAARLGDHNDNRVKTTGFLPVVKSSDENSVNSPVKFG